MPELYATVVLLVDCEVIGEPYGSVRVMPRGSRGVLVDQNTLCPDVWIIEFSAPNSSDIVLVEARQECFAMCDGYG